MEIKLGSNLRLLRKKKGYNQHYLAELMEKAHTTIGNWENGIAEPNLSELTKLSNFYEIPTQDLLYSDLSNVHLIEKGKGIKKQVKSPPNSPSNSPSNQVNEPDMASWNRMPKVVTIDSQGADNMVMVPVRARAGYLLGYDDPEFIQSLPTYRLPGMNNGTYRMFEVQGHSMVPTFHESDIIITRFVENMAEIREDRVHVVLTNNDGVCLKRVVNRIQKDGKLILNSDNQRHAGEYPPIVVSPEDVLEIWYAVAFMSRQMRKPGELYTRLADVESRLTLIEHERKKPQPK